jgi:T5SS/PEP-CTERM-associated repeat protein
MLEFNKVGLVKGILLVGAITMLAMTPDHALATDSERGVVTWRVGASDDPDCDFNDLQDAIDAVIAADDAFPRIRLSGDAAVHAGKTYSIDASDFDDVFLSLQIIGGHASCADEQADRHARTVLDAQGNGRVFDIEHEVDFPGLSIRLENLEIRGGQVSNGGAGLRIRGRPHSFNVTLDGVDVIDNHSTGNFYGGGIRLQPTQSSSQDNAMLSLDRTTIVGNSAGGSGGGLACVNNTGDDVNPILFYTDVELRGNVSDINGGGLMINGCELIVRTDQSLGVDVDLAAVSPRIIGNSASGFGGGIYILNGGRMEVLSEIFHAGNPPEVPMLIVSNDAEFGGGLALRGEAGTEALLVDTVIADNYAREDGGGIYLGDDQDDHAPTLEMRRSEHSACPLPFADQSPCSRLAFNHADGRGGALFMTGSGGPRPVARLYQTVLDRNSSDGTGTVIRQEGRGLVDIEGAAVFGNGRPELDVALFSAQSAADLFVSWTTVAGNVGELGSVFSLSSQANFWLAGSIIWEPEANLIHQFGSLGVRHLGCVIGHASSQEMSAVFDSLSFYSQVDPMLVNPAVGNIRVSHSSPAIDYCDTVDLFGQPETPRNHDIFNNPRGVAYRTIPNPAPNPGDGDYDLGAQERVPDSIDSSSFWEGGTSSDWFNGSNWDGAVPDLNTRVEINTISPNPGLIDKPGAQTAAMRIGRHGTGHLLLDQGAELLTNGFAGIGGALDAAPDASGSVTLAGDGAHWQIETTLSVGVRAAGSLSISDGGMVTANEFVRIANHSADAAGHVEVHGGQSRLNIGTFLEVATEGQGMLDVVNGGEVLVLDHAIIGRDAGSNGMVTVSGANSRWEMFDQLIVGQSGSGALVIADDARVEVVGFNTPDPLVAVATEADAAGRIYLGATIDQPPTAPGRLLASAVHFGGDEGEGDGALVFNHNDEGYRFRPVISGSGRIEVHAGTTELDTDNAGFEGTTDIMGGRLIVNEELGGAVSVTDNGILSGQGSLGTVTVNDGGTLSPGDPVGTLSVQSLTLGPDARLAFDLDLPDSNSGDELLVHGDLVLDGIIDVNALEGFGAGIHFLLHFAGNVTDHGLEVGQLPAGFEGTIEIGGPPRAGSVILVVTAGDQVFTDRFQIE